MWLEKKYIGRQLETLVLGKEDQIIKCTNIVGAPLSALAAAALAANSSSLVALTDDKNLKATQSLRSWKANTEGKSIN